MSKTPVVLCIMDGMAHANPGPGNAYELANTPNLDKLKSLYPMSYLNASGLEVGLPVGQMGNSEVGHLNIGAGRVVYQSLTLINKAIEDHTFYDNEEFLKAIEYVKTNNTALHLMGLLSDGGVHSHIDHLKGLISLAKYHEVQELYVHVFLDGRDTLRDTGLNFVKDILSYMDNVGLGKLADISGRYYAMDRDKRFDRNKLAYDVLVKHEGQTYSDPLKYIQDNYNKEVYDEFIVPAYNPSINGQIKDKDAVISINFRPDRMIQLGSILTNPSYENLDINKELKDIYFVSMMEYDSSVKGSVAFKNQSLDDVLGVYLSKNNKKQLRIAETEKYPHVTFFFDGLVKYDGINLPELDKSKRILVNSPKVATYDLAPEMSAYEITDKLIAELDNDYDVVILNYANGDMVGHTGVIEAAIKAVETVDTCVGRIYDKIQSLNGTLLVTADHGNSEKMLDENNQVFTAHTTNKVEFIVCDKSYTVEDGALCDIAPTILDLLDLEKPEAMTGHSLIKKEGDK